MGYYTLHKISIINKYNNLRNLGRLLDVIKEVADYRFRIESESYIIDDNWNSGNGSKWYSFDEDIYVISKKLPKLKILVEAEEENGHTWVRIVKKGDDSSYSNSPSDNEDYEESEEDEENEDNEDNEEDEIDEEEENNDDINNNYINDDIGIEEMFQNLIINEELIFRR